MTGMARKVCIVGDFAVGKTSLVARYVQNVFSEKYLTTVGVKIDTRQISLADGRDLKLVLWDIAGGERFSAVEYAYLRGAAGYLLVVDGTRARTLKTASVLREEIAARYGELPAVMMLNKSDLKNEWELEDESIAALQINQADIFRTSALTGSNVENAINRLATLVVG